MLELAQLPQDVQSSKGSLFGGRNSSVLAFQIDRSLGVLFGNGFFHDQENLPGDTSGMLASSPRYFWPP